MHTQSMSHHHRIIPLVPMASQGLCQPAIKTSHLLQLFEDAVRDVTNETGRQYDASAVGRPRRTTNRFRRGRRSSKEWQRSVETTIWDWFHAGLYCGRCRKYSLYTVGVYSGFWNWKTE